MTLSELASRLSQASPKRISGSNGFEALCPCHDDHNPSLHIWEGDNGWIKVTCRTCGATDKDVASAIGIENSDLRFLKDATVKTGNSNWTPPAAEHDYHRADGSYAFTKLKMVDANLKKDYPRVVKDQATGKILKGAYQKLPRCDKDLLYNLPAVIAAVQSGDPVHIGEGEKAADALNAIGEVATCQPDGAEVLSFGKSRWLDNYSDIFKGAAVIVWADRDEVGEWYASTVCASLKGKATIVSCVQSKTQRAKDDAFDHIGSGGSPFDGQPRPDLVEKVSTPPRKEPAKDPQRPLDSPTDKPPFDVSETVKPQVVVGEPYAVVRDKVFNAIVAYNDPAKLFQRSGVLALITKHDKSFRVRDAMDYDLRSICADACDFVKWSEKKGKLVVSEPHPRVEAMVRAKDCWPGIPILDGLSECPLLRSDGTFATEVGYDEDTRAYVTCGPWASKSTHGNPAQWLCDEVLGEFPFEDEASRDNAMGLMVLAFVRRIIEGPTPVHYIDAPIVGTGKTLLAQTCLYPSCGFVGASTLPEREEERKKSISSFLLEGAQAIIWDNVDKRVDSGTLAAATTNINYHDRMLGSNAVIDVPVKCIWVMTGNNAELNKDMVRRTVWIRIDAQMERPSQGRKFKKNLTVWCKENREEIVAACCQMVTNWVDAGRPLFEARGMGGFEEYAQIVGGVLMANGLVNFMANQGKLESHADADSLGWGAFHEAVYEDKSNSWWKVGDVVETAGTIEELGHALGTNPDGKRLKFGRSLKRRESAVASELRLIVGRDPHTKQSCYRLVPTKGHPNYDKFADGSTDEPVFASHQPAQTSLPYKED